MSNESGSTGECLRNRRLRGRRLKIQTCLTPPYILRSHDMIEVGVTDHTGTLMDLSSVSRGRFLRFGTPVSIVRTRKELRSF